MSRLLIFSVDNLSMSCRAWFDRTLKGEGARIEPLRISESFEKPSKPTDSIHYKKGKQSYMSTSMSFPLASWAGPTSKAHNIRAILSSTEADPRCIPGQMRRPHPKALWPSVPG